MAGTAAGGSNADVLINGELVISDRLVEAERHRDPDTLSVTVSEPIEAIEVRFDNDGPGRNLFLYAVRVDGVALELTAGVVIKASNGDEFPVENGNEVGLWFNSSYVLTLDETPPPATAGRANNWHPSDTEFNWGGGETLEKVESLLTLRDLTRPLAFDADGRLIDDTPTSSTVIQVPAGLAEPVRHIKDQFRNLDLSMSDDAGGHVTISLAAGEHRFENRLAFKRGDITLEGAGTDQTTIIHDFADGVRIEHAIEFRSSTITGARFGWESNRVVPESELLQNITIQDFTITYQVDPSDIEIDSSEGDIQIEDLRELASQNFVPKYGVPWAPRGNGGTVLPQHQAAISLDGVMDANVVDLTGEMVGSHFIGVHESRRVYADGLVADGTLNRGGGGNGYALELVQSHDSVIRFDAVIDFRHLSINNEKSSEVPDVAENWSTNNVIGAEYTNTNMDIHTLSEDDNILYAENAVANAYIQAQPVGEDGQDGWNGDWIWSYRLHDQRMAWDMFDARNFDSAQNNNWYADNQIAAGSLNRDGEPVGGRVLQILDADHDNFIETLYASANDGHIYGGFQDDTLFAGAGKNTFIYTDDTGTDTIHDFGPEDVISIQKGTLGIGNVAEFDTPGRWLEVRNGDIEITLGSQTVLITDASFFDVNIHVEVVDHAFYDAAHKDFAFFLNP